MVNLEDEVLRICMECKKIELPSNPGMWLDPNNPDHKKLCQIYSARYEGRLSHGYCPDCEKKAKDEFLPKE